MGKTVSCLLASASTRQVSAMGHRVACSRAWTRDHYRRLETALRTVVAVAAEVGPQIAEAGLRIAVAGLQTVEVGLRIAEVGLRIAEVERRIAAAAAEVVAETASPSAQGAAVAPVSAVGRRLGR